MPGPLGEAGLPTFHPATVLRRWQGSDTFRLEDAITGVSVFGATGSGKTSGVARHLALAYLMCGMGGVVLCSKKDERAMWQAWAAETDRTEDLVIVDATNQARFNFLAWESERPGEGGGLAINIVALLDEIASAITGGSGSGVNADGDNNKFFSDALHHLNTNAVELLVLAKIPVSLPALRAVISTAPRSLTQATDVEWQKTSDCWDFLKEAELHTRGESDDVLSGLEECRTYFLKDFPVLNERTRSIITLYFSMLVRPLLTKPLRSLFATDTTVTPEDTFDGKIIVVDLPVQEYRLAGRIANLAWKYCFQVAVMRRTPPKIGFLRPVFLWADEAQNFISRFDAEYQAVARSAAGCTVYLTQNRESYRRVLRDYDGVDSLLGNLQAKFFAQNSSIDTNEWAAKMLGQEWTDVVSTNTGRSGPEAHASSGVSLSEQHRFRVEPGDFTTLRRGGANHDYRVETIVYNGGRRFANGKSFRLLSFDQKR